MASKRTLELKDYLYIIGAILSGGIAYGTMATRQSAQEDKIKQLATVPENLAALTEQVKSIGKQTAETQLDVREIRRKLFP